MRKPVFLLALLFTLSAGAEVIVPLVGGPRVWIPVAGNAQGQNGTFFRSEVTIANLRNVEQRVQVFWLPQGATGPATPLQTYTFPGLRGFTSDDFVGRLLNQTAIGAIELVAVTSAGAFDPQGLLHVTSRIWTPRPDEAPGTMSQTFPSVLVGQSPPANVKAVYGMSRGTQYRLNVGVLNPSATTQRFHVEVTINGPSGVSVENVEFDVKPRSIEQVLIPGTSTGGATVIVEDLGGGAGDWLTWASSVDNQSGDAWSQMGFGIPGT